MPARRNAANSATRSSARAIVSACWTSWSAKAPSKASMPASGARRCRAGWRISPAAAPSSGQCDARRGRPMSDAKKKQAQHAPRRMPPPRPHRGPESFRGRRSSTWRRSRLSLVLHRSIPCPGSARRCRTSWSRSAGLCAAGDRRFRLPRPGPARHADHAANGRREEHCPRPRRLRRWFGLAGRLQHPEEGWLQRHHRPEPDYLACR